MSGSEVQVEREDWSIDNVIHLVTSKSRICATSESDHGFHPSKSFEAGRNASVREVQQSSGAFILNIFIIVLYITAKALGPTEPPL